MALLLRHWVVASWFPIPNQGGFTFETEEEPDLPSGPVVGVAALPSLNHLWGQSPLFLKDDGSSKLDNSVISSYRIPEFWQLSFIPYHFFSVLLSVSAGWISAAIIPSLFLASAEVVD